ncbi:hypothetical protein [Shinella sp.]|uniref:hypothetical protein n=1 Tax=Shinella sp. TaxID=1870904 RepID=UPI002897DBDB|nr:hypothetical protein [Shinella sp.]
MITLKNQQKMRLALICGTAVSAMATAWSASAQDRATQLEEVRVEQGAQNVDIGIEPVKGVVAKTSRTGSKTASELRDIPQSVSLRAGCKPVNIWYGL